MEFEEYNLKFHMKKSSKKKNSKTELINKAKEAKAKTAPNVDYAKKGLQIRSLKKITIQMKPTSAM